MNRSILIIALSCTCLHACDIIKKVSFDWNQILYAMLDETNKPRSSKLLQTALDRGAEWNKVLLIAHKNNNAVIKKIALLHGANWNELLVDGFYQDDEELQNLALSQGASWEDVFLLGESTEKDHFKLAAQKKDITWYTVIIRALADDDYTVINKALQSDVFCPQKAFYKLVKINKPALVQRFITTMMSHHRYNKNIPVIKVKKADKNGNTALHKACQHNALETTKFLLRIELPINHQNKLGLTPLHYAAQYGHKDLIELLLSWNSDTTIKNNNDALPQDIAASYGFPMIVFMLKHMQPFFMSKNKALTVLTHKKGLYFFKYMLWHRKQYATELSRVYTQAQQYDFLLQRLDNLLGKLRLKLDDDLLTPEYYQILIKNYTKTGPK